jgi:HD-like signal output (HDOD) protein
MADIRSPRTSGAGASALPRVMFVDDEEAILSALRSLLRKEAYALSFFSDPAAALEHLASAPSDVVVSDLRMPTISGIEFLNKASSLCPNAIRIMLSGYEDKHIVLNALAQGLARDYVMKPWDDEALRALIAESLRLHSRLHEQKLREILGSAEHIPSPPQCLGMLATILEGTDTSITDIVEEIEKNPPLIARLLRVANSVHYGARRAVNTVREAVLFVGTEYVASLVLAIEAFEKLHPNSGTSDGKVMEALWNQALYRATLAKAVAELWDGFQDRHLAFVASLFQDIGFVVRAYADPGRMQEFLQLTETDGIPILEADARIFGITHDEVGSALLKYWNFPSAIVAAVAGHHRPPGNDALLQILLIADNLEWSSRISASAHPLDEVTTRWVPRLQHLLTSRPQSGESQ